MLREVREIQENIFRIGGQPSYGNPCSYLIRSRDRDILIFSGIYSNSAWDAVNEDLWSLRSIPAKRDVLLTNTSLAQIGKAGLLAGEMCHIYMSRIEVAFVEKLNGRDYARRLHSRYLKSGLSERMLAPVEEGQFIECKIQGMLERIRPICTDAPIRVGEYSFAVVEVPGSTPGGIMLWEEAHGIMFCGEHIRFDREPHIGKWLGYAESMRHYLESLEKAKEYPVKVSLSGYCGEGSYRQRADELIEFHRTRMATICKLIRSQPNLCEREILERLGWYGDSWWDKTRDNRLPALDECIAYLDYLKESRQIVRRLENSVWRYHAAE